MPEGQKLGGVEGQVDDAMTEGQPASLVTTQHYLC